MSRAATGNAAMASRMTPMICVGSIFSSRRDRQGEHRQFAFHVGVQRFEGPRQTVQHSRQHVHLRPHLATSGLAALREALLEGFLVGLPLQIGEPAHGGHFLPGGRSDVRSGPQRGAGRVVLAEHARQNRPRPSRSG